MQASTIRIIQTVTTFLIIAFSIAIIGCASHALHFYKNQRDTNPWWLPLWPDHFNVRGTTTQIGASATVLALNAFYLAMLSSSFFNLSDHPTIRALVLLATTSPAAVITLGSLAYNDALNRNSPSVDTIQTWTCRYRDVGLAFDGRGAGTASNEGFRRVCDETKFAFYTTITVFALQALMLVGAIVGCSVQRRERRVQRAAMKEAKEAASLEMSDMERVSADKEEPSVMVVESRQ